MHAAGISRIEEVDEEANIGIDSRSTTTSSSPNRRRAKISETASLRGGNMLAQVLKKKHEESLDDAQHSPGSALVDQLRFNAATVEARRASHESRKISFTRSLLVGQLEESDDQKVTMERPVTRRKSPKKTSQKKITPHSLLSPDSLTQPTAESSPTRAVVASSSQLLPSLLATEKAQQHVSHQLDVLEKRLEAFEGNVGQTVAEIFEILGLPLQCQMTSSSTVPETAIIETAHEEETQQQQPHGTTQPKTSISSHSIQHTTV